MYIQLQWKVRLDSEDIYVQGGPKEGELLTLALQWSWRAKETML
jgi:hypothetical protein